MLRFARSHFVRPINSGRLMQAYSTSAGTTSESKTVTPPARLPRLPVPKLDQTLRRYLASLEPFLLEDEARGGTAFDEAFALRQQWANDFENGIGKMLQERLHALDKASPNNWLDDNIWLKKAYHEWRAPLIVNSNWWLSFQNDSTIPMDVQSDPSKDNENWAGITGWQVRRAAWLMHRSLEFKQQLERQEIYPNTTKNGLWFQRTIGLNFNTARIPMKGCDTFSSRPSPPFKKSARSILVIVHDWQYTIEVIDRSSQLINPKELEKRLLQVVEDVSDRLKSGERAVPVGVLTADERDRWADNQQYLMSISPVNRASLKAINHSILALSLDPWTYAPDTPSSSQPLPQPNTPEEMDAHLHNLRSSHSSHPGHNRWFDKPYTIIVESNGRAGANGEHSPCDALVPSIMGEYSVVQEIDLEAFPYDFFFLRFPFHPPSCKRLNWVVDSHITAECARAESRIRPIVQDSDDHVLWFDAYGTDFIKHEVGTSPDAYIQMALQLAWYRTRGEFTATYETALTRLFHHARTETIRTYSKESRAWVLAMVNDAVSNTTKRELFDAAIQAHSRYSRAAAAGKGIDRHLLGLRCMMKPEELEDMPALFCDELFTRSQTWKLSTSSLSPGDQFRGTGFGTPEPDGYGISYLPGRDIIKFGIESKHSCPSTSTQLFSDALTQSLLDLRELCLVPPRAHL